MSHPLHPSLAPESPAAPSRPGELGFVVEITDEALAALAMEGDTGAYGTLVRRHQSGVFAAIYRLVKSREEAEDLTQDGFVLAFRKLDKYDNARKFKPWLYRVALNNALSQLRKKRPDVSFEAIEEAAGALPDESARSADRIVEDKKTARKIAEAVAQLSPLAQSVFKLRYQDDLTLEEIAESLEMKANTVAVTLHRARLKLRELLQEEVQS